MHLLDAHAWCSGCKWEYGGKNAMGLAAIHHKKTGHFTMVELYYSQTFGEVSPKGEPLSSPQQAEGYPAEGK